jgi:DNA-binding Xre family transcriptional regulator
MGMLKDRLAEAMRRKGMWQVEKDRPDVAALVKATGLSKSAIHFMLDGQTKAETVRATTIDKLAEALSADRDWLLYGEETVKQVRPASHVGRLDPAKLPLAREWMRIAIGAAEAMQLPLEDDLPLLAEVYNFAADCGWDTRKAKWEALRAAIKRRDKQGVNDGKRNAGRSNANGTD